MLPLKRIWLGLSLLLAASSCSDFEEWKVLDSGSGIYAKISIPVSKDAFAVCLSPDEKESCSQRKAIYYGFRSQNSDVRWLSKEHLLILQTGGEIWKRPKSKTVTVETRSVAVTVNYFPE